jgi:hypothetical protein
VGDSVASDSGENGQERRLACSVSQANGEDLAGTGTPFGGYLLVEVAGPWGYDVGQSRDFPEGLWEAVMGLWDAGIMEKFTAVMPDREYSREGHSRAILLRRPGDSFFASYQKEDYLVPEDELVPLVEALSEPEGPSRFARYGENTSHVRDVLVCTHGSHDVCCGRFGYSLYKELRQEYTAASEGKLRVWRTSHLGGHRFAPNLIDLPEGRYWGRMRPEDLENFVMRKGSVSELKEFYRGWAGLGGEFEQIAEGEAFAREGWEWVEYPKAGEVVEADEDGERAEVRIEYRTPDGASGAYEATVEAVGSVETLMSSGTGELKEARQYGISRFEKTNLS